MDPEINSFLCTLPLGDRLLREMPDVIGHAFPGIDGLATHDVGSQR